ncbi:MAG: hypothetical protein GY865_03415 [candidate division Zixibacteria bacterium]|nr:hypothetical protein [candidate division Zixibacteria bacterium]
MNKPLMFLWMILLVVAFMAPDETKAQSIELLNPPDDYQLTVQETNSVTLSYQFSGPGAILLRHHVQVDDNIDFSSPQFDDSDLPASPSTIGVSGFSNRTYYYWRVRALYMMPGGEAIATEWTVTRKFRFYVPGLITPVYDATNQNQPLLLDWQTVFTGFIMNVGYQLLVDDNSDFSSPEIDITTTGSSNSVSDLDEIIKYYWKVRCYSTDPQFPYNTTYYRWSQTWIFTTGIAWLCGDFDYNEDINILDIVYLINYKYKGGPVPDPIESADVNSHVQPDGLINILDIVYLINFKYKAGPEPVCP